MEYLVGWLEPLAADQAPARGSSGTTLYWIMAILVALAVAFSILHSKGQNPVAGPTAIQASKPAAHSAGGQVLFTANPDNTKATPVDSSYKSSPLPNPVAKMPKPDAASVPQNLAARGSEADFLAKVDDIIDGDTVHQPAATARLTLDDNQDHEVTRGGARSLASAFDFMTDWPPPLPSQWNPFYSTLKQYVPVQYHSMLKMVGVEAVSLIALAIPCVYPGVASRKAPDWVRRTAWLAPRAVTVQALAVRLVHGFWLFTHS